MQVEQEGVSVKGSSLFNPDPDAETLYKAMKGIGELPPVACPLGSHIRTSSESGYQRQLGKDSAPILFYMTPLPTTSH